MLISPVWAVIGSCFLMRRPLERCIVDAHTFSTSNERWLLFFVCFVPVIFPLHMICIGSYMVPFRWELTIIYGAILSQNDARGAQSVFVGYIGPSIELVVAALQEKRDAFVKASEPAPTTLVVVGGKE